MFPLLALLFLVVPLVELYVIVKVAGSLGTLNTVGLVFLVSIVGAWLVRAEGFAIINRVRSEMSQMRVPSKAIVDGALVMFAGALLLTPGFVTDGLGLFLLIPPTRALVRNVIMSRYKDKIQVTGPAGFGRSQTGPNSNPNAASGGFTTNASGDIIDVSATDLSGRNNPNQNTPKVRPQDTLDDTAP